MMLDAEPNEIPPAKRFCSTQLKGRYPSEAAISASVEDLSSDVVSRESDNQESRSKHLALLNTTASINTTLSKPTNDPVEEEEEERGGGGLQHYHCDACQKDITHVFRIRCGECLDFDLCVTCFVNGVETGNHRNDHSYIPIGLNDFPIFSQNWNAVEEMILLEGVSKFGFGNWGEIAELLAPYSSQPKRKDQCEEHYYSVHIVSSRESQMGELPEDEEAKQREYRRRMIGEHHVTLPQGVKPSAAGNSACNIVGFMPLRGDFDVEYDNDAELILSDIEFRGDEIPVDRELKLKVLDIYNARVNERILRKKVVIEKGLVDWRKMQQLGRRKTKEEIDLMNLFRLLARFDLDPDYEELANLFLSERKLRHHLQNLNEWRSLGFKTFTEVEKYERMKCTRIGGFDTESVSEQNRPKQTLKSSNNRRSTTKADMNQAPSSAEESLNEQKENGQLFNKLEAPAAEYPGAPLLTDKELQFCDTLQIPPVYFLMTKYSLLNVLIQQSNPSVLHQMSKLRLDATRQGNLYDFILHTKLDLPEFSLSESSQTRKQNVDASQAICATKLFSAQLANDNNFAKKSRIRKKQTQNSFFATNKAEEEWVPTSEHR